MIKLTTREVKQRLSTKYEGDQFATFFEVADSTGSAGGYCDCVVFNLWKSRGYLIHGFEIKVSRGDWLKELKNAKKAEKFYNRVDCWWVVAGDKSIVKHDELPPGWGLMVPYGKGLKIAVQAKKDPAVDHMTRGWLASLMRRASSRPLSNDEKEQIQAKRDAYNRGVDDAKGSAKVTLKAMEEGYERARADLRQIRQQVSGFERETGIMVLPRFGHKQTSATAFNNHQKILNDTAPHEMRRLAASLLKLAGDCEDKQTELKHKE